jgi:hypothetical protein
MTAEERKGRVEMNQLYLTRFAVVIGLALPLGEVVRRWGTTESWTFWIVHLAVGAPLLYGAWLHSRDRTKGLRVLAAAWGFSCGILYPSFFYWWNHPPRPDPADLLSKPVWLVMLSNAFVGGSLGIALIGLFGTVRASEHSGKHNLPGSSVTAGAKENDRTAEQGDAADEVRDGAQRGPRS